MSRSEPFRKGAAAPVVLSADAEAAIAAEVMTPAELQALELRERMARTAASPSPGFAFKFGLGLSRDELARLRSAAERAQAKLKEHRRAQRAAKAAKRAGLRLDPKPDPIAAAIERAHARELELAKRTPERLWTAAQRAAVERARAKGKAAAKPAT